MAGVDRHLEVTDELFDYLVAHGTPPDEHYRAITADTLAAAPDRAGMQIGPDQYALLTLLARLVGATFAVEVGTFTGSSALAVAKGLAPGGRLLCCDVSEEWTAIARRHWEAAGVADRVELRLAPALDTLRSLPPTTVVDFAFVDADKPSYVDYYEALVPLLRPGGLLVADNVLWSGRVIDPASTDENTEAIRRFNDHVAADDRVETVMLAVGDGITLCRKLDIGP
jgi:caffeoyl-CoA O-methyltransferase